LIYTSGSTGLPKGVLLMHGNALSYFEGHQPIIGVNEQSRIVNFSPFFFDVSFLDTYLFLAMGGSTYIAAGLPIPSKHLRLMEEFEATHLLVTATMLNILSGGGKELESFSLPDLRFILAGAEVLEASVVRPWMSLYPHITVFNLYGLRQASVVQLSHRIDHVDEDGESGYSLGKPHSTVLLRLHDDADQLIEQPHQIGELLIGGPQVMKGYWNNAESTRRSIVEYDGCRF